MLCGLSNKAHETDKGSFSRFVVVHVLNYLMTH